MATKYPKRYYRILPKGLPRETCECCGRTFVRDPDDPDEEPCGLCWVMQCDHINPKAKDPQAKKRDGRQPHMPDSLF